MKRQILVFACFAFMVSILQAQTTYTYTGTGDWTDTANWRQFLMVAVALVLKEE